MSHAFANGSFHLLLQVGIFVDGFLHSSFHVFGVVEEGADTAENVLLEIHAFFCCFTGDGFDAADTCGYAAFTDDAEETEFTGCADVCTTTELYAITELYNTYAVTIFFSEEGNRSHVFSFFDGHIAVILEGDVFADATIDDAFDLAQFLGCYFLEVREVETKTAVVVERTFLLYVGAEDFAECLVEQVSSGVVGFNFVTTIFINTCHEFCFRMLGKCLGEVDGKVVFALGVEDFHCFFLIDEHTSVTYLSTHFSIEWRVVEYEFEVGLLLLLHLTIFQDAATIFGVVPTVESGVAFCQYHPVACFCGSGIACALLLLLHFCIKTSFVHRETGFRTDEFGEVEGETIGVEEGEGFFSFYHFVACCLRGFNDIFQTVDTSGKGAKE